MKLIYPNSLASTLDAVNEAIFYKQDVSKSERTQVAKWIAARQGKPGSYADMFAPTKRDFKKGIKLFTGEKVSTHAGLSHVLGQEASRVLILLDVNINNVQAALKRATIGIKDRIHGIAKLKAGMYCCVTCSCSLWRHISVGGLGNDESVLVRGMKTLNSRRDGKGRWKTFPFYYTLLALSEIELSLAVKEMRYAAPICERYLKRKPKKDKISQRRRMLVERILGKC